jgi:hypothetical protein
MKVFLRSAAAALVFIAVLVYVFTAERGRVPEKEEIFGLDVADAISLEIVGGDSEVLLEKREGTWYVNKPFKGLANETSAEERVRAIAELKPVGKRKDADLDSEDFGLKTPRVTAVLRYGQGNEVKVSIGKDLPVGAETYARIEGREQLYIIPSSVLTTLKKTAEDLREKKLVQVKDDDVRSLKLSHGATEVKVENRREADEDKWFITAPITARADEFQVEQAVSKVTELKAEAFVQEVGEASKYGLDKPSLRVELVDKDGKKSGIAIGAECKEPVETSETDLVFARADGRDEVMVLKMDAVEELRKKPLDLRDKSLVEVNKDDINYVRVQSKKRLSFALKRLPDGWHLDRPVKAKATPAKVDDILWDIVQLEARDYIEEKPENLKQYGLAIPDTIIEVHTLGSDEVLKIKIGYAHGEDAHYCQTSESDEVYAVSDMLLMDLPTKIEEMQSSS